MKCKQILGSSKGHEVIKVSHFVRCFGALHIFEVKSIKFCVCVCVCVCERERERETTGAVLWMQADSGLKFPFALSQLCLWASYLTLHHVHSGDDASFAGRMQCTGIGFWS